MLSVLPEQRKAAFPKKSGQRFSDLLACYFRLTKNHYSRNDGEGFSLATFSEKPPKMHVKWEKLLSSVPLVNFVDRKVAITSLNYPICNATF